MRTNNSIAVARLRWVALGAAELLAAHGEYEMTTQIGVSPWLAWLFPVGLGVYAFCAFASGSRTDVRAALALMTACQALAHLLAVDVLPRHWLLVVTVSAVAPISCWRVHHRGEHAAAQDATPPAPEPGAVTLTLAAPSPQLATRVMPRPRVRLTLARRPRQIAPVATAPPPGSTCSADRQPPRHHDQAAHPQRDPHDDCPAPLRPSRHQANRNRRPTRMQYPMGPGVLDRLTCPRRRPWIALVTSIRGGACRMASSVAGSGREAAPRIAPANKELPLGGYRS